MLSAPFPKPGMLYVVATLLPLATCVILLIAGLVRGTTKSYKPSRLGAYLCTGAMIVAAVLSIFGLSRYIDDRKEWVEKDPAKLEALYTGHLNWAELPMFPGTTRADHASVLQIGYRIDMLNAILFAMVTFIGSLIFIFSLGYMKEETQVEVEDHEVHLHHGHFHRHGRYGRFFLFLSLFCFSMLNLLIADNLFQVFISWELVGVCSFFLIGFYQERDSAARAANKAFIMNRVGDVGFLVGLAIVWVNFGTFNFQELFPKVHMPANVFEKPDAVLIVMGLGIFLGCVGKSAQFPLHTWLPDAMEGPTPVSALIHAATMVAAGVYLVGRCYPLFAPEVLLVIAYTGAITAFLAATIAVAQDDIKRVLAYSTVSQLGFMMLALGVGGWTAGLMHLVTHAFFKALLFLGAGSVIHGCHHEQNLRKMGGLWKKMPFTAITMLFGVLAIAGTPFFSGWYSKERILDQVVGFANVYHEHALLMILPGVTIALTAFYMFRMWFLAFSGLPRDLAIHDKVHESPILLTLPLVILALCSLGIAWGWPIWDVDASQLGRLLEEAQPTFVHFQFAETIENAREMHVILGFIPLLITLAGAIVAWWLFVRKTDWALAKEAKPNFVHAFFARKWYFDELYAFLFQRPILRFAKAAAIADKSPPGSNPAKADRTINPNSLDGLWNALGLSLFDLGWELRRLQSGRLRSYVMILVLTSGCLFAILSILLR